MSAFYVSVERFGNDILHRGYDSRGVPFSKKVKFQPTFYIPTKQDTKFRSLIGEYPIGPKKFENMSDAKEFLEKYKDVNGFEVYGNSNYIAQYIQETYPKDIKFDMKLINIFSFDIETDSSSGWPDMDTADKEITSIAIKSSKSDTYHLLGRKEYDKSKTITGIDPDKIQFMKFDTEEALLKRFVEIWTNNYPDVVTGWNVEYFDIMYIVTRIIRLLGEEWAKRLSPWRSIKKVSNEIFGRVQSTYKISGLTIVDYMDAFKKFGYKYGPQESYKLDHIAHVVLGQKKLSYEEYGSLNELYVQNPQLYLDYNLKDTHLIELLEEESALLSLVLTVAYGGGVNYSDAFGTTGIWDTTIYRRLMQKNIVPFVKGSPDTRVNDALVGGYVKSPVPGMYKWVVSFDLNSLYPHLMLQYNMSPETYMSNVRKNINADSVLGGLFQNESKDYSVAGNGVCFTKEFLGIIPEIISEYYDERKKIKNEMLRIEQLAETEQDEAKKKELKKEIVQLHNSQMRIKISMNSLYGAVANKYFIYYIYDMAEAITVSGQLSIRWAEKVVNSYLNSVLKTEKDYIIYMDTDSIYVDMSHLIKKVFGTTDIDRKTGEEFLDKVCKEKVEKAIEVGYEELSERLGCYRNAMSMKREKITDRSIFVAKKRYILNALNSEGVHYEKPKIGVTGLESVRSSTPEVCRDKLKESFEVIMNSDEEAIQKFIQDFRKEFATLPIEEIAKISGTDDIKKYMDKQKLYKSGCPIHVRGSILYNDYLKRMKLDKKYQEIQSGDKVKFVYLKTPNPIRENVISFVNAMPKELALEAYIDYDTQFEKVFLKPLASILEAIGWSAEKVDTLEDFFA